MDSDSSFKQEDVRNNLSNDSNIPKPIWVRYFGLQIDAINEGLLAHNIRVICFVGPILWVILSLI